MLAGQDGWVLEASARRHHFEGAGTLSIKSFRRGRALYSVGGGRVVLGPGDYLLLNEGQQYTIEIDAREPVDSTCVFFPAGFAATALPALIQTKSELLDAPDPVQTPVRDVPSRRAKR